MKNLAVNGLRTRRMGRVNTLRDGSSTACNEAVAEMGTRLAVRARAPVLVRI